MISTLFAILIASTKAQDSAAIHYPKAMGMRGKLEGLSVYEGNVYVSASNKTRFHYEDVMGTFKYEGPISEVHPGAIQIISSSTAYVISPMRRLLTKLTAKDFKSDVFRDLLTSYQHVRVEPRLAVDSITDVYKAGSALYACSFAYYNKTFTTTIWELKDGKLEKWFAIEGQAMTFTLSQDKKILYAIEINAKRDTPYLELIKATVPPEGQKATVSIRKRIDSNLEAFASDANDNIYISGGGNKVNVYNSELRFLRYLRAKVEASKFAIIGNKLYVGGHCKGKDDGTICVDSIDI